MAEHPISNTEIADALERVADLLEAQNANHYRVRAYRTAAATIRHHDTPLCEVFAEGTIEAITALLVANETTVTTEFCICMMGPPPPLPDGSPPQALNPPLGGGGH